MTDSTDAEAAPRALWRVFPWDATATSGAPFAADHVPRASGRGRFDLPARSSSVLYLAETPEHAVAEMLHPWRGRTIDERHIVRAGRRLAAVALEVEPMGVADLCDPDVLVRLGIAPDRTASRHRAPTQAIARAVWEAGYPGLRWWSRFWGDWHTVVIFTSRVGGGGRILAPVFSQPEPLTLRSPAVIEASRLLGMEIGG